MTVDALRPLLAPNRSRAPMVPVPGCWDGLSALMVEQAGFPAAFLSGAALSMTRLGRPDLGLVGLTELSETVALICDRVSIPLIVDGDTGFGNVLNMQRTVRVLEKAGAAAIQIEDQGFPKRCGHMAGKTVVPLAEARGRIAAALDTRTDMLVIARTDALAVEGLEAALDRAEAYLEAGADAIFVEGPRDMAEAEAIATRFADRVGLLVNLVEGGTAPCRDPAPLATLGFAVSLHPLLLLHGLIAKGPTWLGHLRQSGSTESLDIASLKDANRITGADEALEWSAGYE